MDNKEINNNYIFALDEDNFYEKIMLADIFYIETIKSTHYCNVMHRNGTSKLHADITPLSVMLGKDFFRARASTLVNIHFIRRVDTKNRVIYFPNDLSCSYAIKKHKELKEKLMLCNYRSSKSK
ncbi:MAG TPA: LytTR family transcriptional regulator DNA-binding domain-containing protein [Lachnospiraceae bacterium]|nr:LytTR family transcriptional regulator DNA-binding domain-containing protein [Lachnospiraceae bacterium]